MNRFVPTKHTLNSQINRTHATVSVQSTYHKLGMYRWDSSINEFNDILSYQSIAVAYKLGPC